MTKGITRERTGVLLQQLFRLLLEHPDGLPAKDALTDLAACVELTDHEAGEYDGGGRRFDKIVRFATVDAVKAGWMRKNKGIWSVTDEGKRALQEIQNADEFYREASRLYRKWRKSQVDESGEAEEATQEKEAKITFEEAEEQAWREISAYLETIDPYHLQDIVAALLEAMGYHVDWVSPPGKDGGLDVIAYSDPLGTKPPRIKVQVKRRKDAIGVAELRSFIALINDDDVGVFVTTGSFSREAQELARHQERRKITLIDQQRLVDLWIDHQDKIELDMWEALPLKPIFFLAPSD